MLFVLITSLYVLITSLAYLFVLNIFGYEMGTTQTHPTPTNQIQINLINLNCSEQAQFCAR